MSTMQPGEGGAGSSDALAVLASLADPEASAIRLAELNAAGIAARSAEADLQNQIAEVAAKLVEAKRLTDDLAGREAALAGKGERLEIEREEHQNAEAHHERVVAAWNEHHANERGKLEEDSRIQRAEREQLDGDTAALVQRAAKVKRREDTAHAFVTGVRDLAKEILVA